MSKKDQTTEFPKKYLDKLSDEFVSSANSMKEDELKKVIVECEGNIYTVEQAKDDDEKLNGCRDLLKELSAPYNDAKKFQTAKIKYCLFMLEGRGVNLDNTEDKS